MHPRLEFCADSVVPGDDVLCLDNACAVAIFAPCAPATKSTWKLGGGVVAAGRRGSEAGERRTFDNVRRGSAIANQRQTECETNMSFSVKSKYIRHEIKSSCVATAKHEEHAGEVA